MKKFILAIILVAFIAILPQQSYAQCDADKFMTQCNSQLVEGYAFLKSYKIDASKATNNKIEYSYCFSKDTNYLISLCGPDGGAGNMVVTLYDSQRKQLMTSYDKKNNKFMPLIGTRINATGLYYFTFTFEGDGPKCGGAVVAFKR